MSPWFHNIHPLQPRNQAPVSDMTTMQDYLMTFGCLGEWLLNPKLIHKRLDVRIKGTASTLFHNGRYENTCGFVVLEAAPSSVNTSIVVKLGWERTQRKFPLLYLSPELTTENSPFVSAELARSVLSSVGQRVVIIGPDINGDSRLVGYYGTIIRPEHDLFPVCACVLVRYSGEGYASYFHEKSICRSLVE